MVVSNKLGDSFSNNTISRGGMFQYGKINARLATCEIFLCFLLEFQLD